MIYRLIDKFMIASLSVGFLLLLFVGNEKGSDWSYANSSSGAVVVCLLLGILILATVTEVFRQGVVSICLAIGSTVLACFVPEATILLASSSYALFSDTKMEDQMEKYHGQKSSGENILVLFRTPQMWLRLVLNCGAIFVVIFQQEYYLLILLAVAMILAIKTMFMMAHDKLLTAKYDKMRFDARKSNRLREEVSHNIDMKVQNATLAERNRIAREIHDNVGHMLTRAVVQLQAISVINQDEQTKPYIESVSSTVNEAMTNIRRSVHELHDDSIDLSIGIHEIASVLKEKFDVEVSTSIESPVPNTLKNAILGIVKEGVTNIAKHSNGKKVRLEVVENVTFWRVVVFDDGKSENLELSRSSDFAALGGEHGIGLSNIYSRAKSCGGRVTIQGGAKGFSVTVTIPKE